MDDDQFFLGECWNECSFGNMPSNNWISIQDWADRIFRVNRNNRQTWNQEQSSCFWLFR